MPTFPDHAYHERGEGRPVPFLHGNPTSSCLWRDVIPELMGRGRKVETGFPS